MATESEDKNSTKRNTPRKVSTNTKRSLSDAVELIEDDEQRFPLDPPLPNNNPT